MTRCEKKDCRCRMTDIYICVRCKVWREAERTKVGICADCISELVHEQEEEK